MSFARGFIKGFIGQSLDNKAEADRRLGELTDKISLDYLNNKRPAFEKNEDLMLKRYNTIKTELGEPSALYASATGSTETDFATKRLLDLKGDERAAFIDAVSKIDFQNFNRDLGVATRTKNFNERNKEITDTFKKIPGGLPNAVTDLFMPLPEGTMPESTFDVTSLPSVSSMIPTTRSNAFTALDTNARTDFVNKGRYAFDLLEKNDVSKQFRRSYESGYDSSIHGPSREGYAFSRFLKEYYGPSVNIEYDVDIFKPKKDTTKQTSDTGGMTQAQPSKMFDTSNTFTYNGKLYDIPQRFEGQSVPELSKKFIASEQDKMPLNSNNPNVRSAQNAINIIRATNPNDERIELIKQDLRKLLGVNNLEGLIS